MSSTDKLYGLGVSDGGYFESAVSRALGFSAGALGIAGGLVQYFDPNTNIPTVNGTSHQLTPTIFVLEQQDGTSGVTNSGPYPAIIGIGPSGIEQGYCDATELQTLASPAPACNTTITPNPYPSSIPGVNFYINPPSPAYPARFAQVAGVSASTARVIDTWMQSKGCIDTNGLLCRALAELRCRVAAVVESRLSSCFLSGGGRFLQCRDLRGGTFEGTKSTLKKQ